MQDAVVTPSAETKIRVFISYSRKDMAFADRLEAALKAHGFEVLIDREEIYAFEDWWNRIQSLIGVSDTVVFVLSPDSVKSEVALKEVLYAASRNKRFAPIVCRDVDARLVPEALHRLNFVYFEDSAKFDESVDELADALQVNIVWIREHTKFGEEARNWIATGRPSGFLLRSPALEMAEHWIATRPAGAPSPAEETRAFIVASRHAARSSRRLRQIVTVSMFTLLIGIILGLVGWINQDYLKRQWRWWTLIRPYAATQVWPYVLSTGKERTLKSGDIFKECAQDCPEMVVVSAGSFTMGSTPTQILGPGRPQHTVRLAEAFAVAKYEVTFDQWAACVDAGGCGGYSPSDSGMGRRTRPAIFVSWHDAQAYVVWLSLVTGKTYRLLSEAEYEYAARAGTTTTFPWGDALEVNGKEMANCAGCGQPWLFKGTSPVGTFAPNKFGLYDIVGNVLEWVEDCYHSNYNGAPIDGSAWTEENGGDCNRRIIRGGAWNGSTEMVASGERDMLPSETRSGDLGFRVARTLNAH